MRKLAVLVVAIVFCAGGKALASSVFQNGGDRLVNTQYTDGAWGWPLDAPPTYGNTIGPIAMGLAKAYEMTGDPTMRAALLNAGTYLLAKTNFSPSDGYLAAELDKVFAVTTYTDYVKANYYDKLAAGTYLRDGIFYNTASYISEIAAERSSSGIGNLAAWDIGMGLVGAKMAGADTSAWVTGTEDAINNLSLGYYDVIGLAGAVYGLATAGVVFNPTSGEDAAADSVADLAQILASYQINMGGFAWESDYVIPNMGNESNQETAYAILALNAVNPTAYLANIQGAAGYLDSVQLGTGGWNDYVGDPDEYNEITGEAMWGLATAAPEPLTLLGVFCGVSMLGGYIRRRRAA